MTVEERYRATAGEDADPNSFQPGYTIDVHFLGGLSESQKALFKGAARRWSRVITGDLPDMMVGGQRVDDLLIYAKGDNIDGQGRVLGQAGPLQLRPRTYLPATGSMTFDIADLPGMERNGSLEDVIVHEMGHCIGVGTIRPWYSLLDGRGGADPTFRGPNAMREYGLLLRREPTFVPVENTGGRGTRDSHWRETTFGNEMMTGYVRRAGNPISRLTVAALADLGYVTDLNAAEAYTLSGRQLEPTLVEEEWEMLATEPEVLPDDAFVDA